jgi:hypothetical protein
VAFYGDATNMPGGASNYQIYVHDLRRGKTRLASRSNTGAPQNGSTAMYGKVSNDGRFVAF